MKYMNMINKYYNAAGEHGGDGGGAGEPSGTDDKTTYTKADVDALVAKAVAEQMQGLFQFAHSRGVRLLISFQQTF